MLETNENEQEWIKLGEAAREIGPGVSTQAAWRACRIGVKAKNGERVRLEHRRNGRAIYTKRVWIKNYLDALNAADLEYFKAAPRPAAPSPERVAQALAVLREDGYKIGRASGQ